jgi:hypothetical protein
MPAPLRPPSGGGASPGPRAGYANPNMRISDAERSEVADRLSAHYGDGRLDQDEFNRRLDQAMGATTQADLSGLFADLPDLDPRQDLAGPPPRSEVPPPAEPPGQLARRPPRRLPTRLLAIVLVIVVATAIGHSLAHLLPWVVIAIVAILWLWYRGRRRG